MVVDRKLKLYVIKNDHIIRLYKYYIIYIYDID